MGAVISMCPAPGMLRENVLELPVRFIYKDSYSKAGTLDEI